MKSVFLALLLGASALPSPARAQQGAITQAIAGTRLDLVASGEITRIPDTAVVSAGVTSHGSTASSALQDASLKMQRVIAALKRAGISDRDIKTNEISLSPEYRYPENQAPQLVGYNSTSSVTARLRDIQRAGKILDSLAAEGANQLSGPTLVVDQPEAALDEARRKAVEAGRARADLYAHSLGMQVVRVVSVSEADTTNVQPPFPVMMEARAAAATKIEPGEQSLKVRLAMVFELK